MPRKRGSTAAGVSDLRGDRGDRDGGDSVRFLWFLVGFLLGVVTTTLGLLWMMARAVVA
ncbi:MAG: hypothetical protein WC277_10055 [Bacilli bacterium]